MFPPLRILSSLLLISTPHLPPSLATTPPSPSPTSSPSPDLLFPLQQQPVSLRIIGGTRTHPKIWPMIVSIQNLMYDSKGKVYYGHFCGGTVWNGRWILTAAHCLFHNNRTLNLKHTTVFIGLDDSDDTQCTKCQFKVAKAVHHPRFEAAHSGNDIGLLKLARPIDFKGANKGVQCTCGQEANRKPVAERCYVVGYGHEQEGGLLTTTKLRDAPVPLRDAAYCKQKAFIGEAYNSEATYCAGFNAGGKDACQGDSGGPLLCSVTQTAPYVYAQFGVVSHGTGCGRVDSPGYYTNVNYYRSWIKSKTGC